MTISRLKDRDAGETVVGADDDADFDNIIDELNTHTAATAPHSGHVLDTGDTITGNVIINISSDDNGLTTQQSGNNTARVRSSGLIEFAGANNVDWHCNLGMSLSSNTLTIHDAGGTALSASNPGWVSCSSTTDGQYVSLKVTSPFTLNDDGHASSHLTGWEWGITSGTDWAQNMPFFLYVVNRANSDLDGSDGNSCLALSRTWRADLTPSSANNIGDHDSAPTTNAQGDFLLLGSYTEANYTSLPCRLIGAVQMRYTGSTTDWTIQSFTDRDGIGRDYLDRTYAFVYTFPTGQCGADSGSYIISGAGTPPAFSTNEIQYKLSSNGNVYHYIRMLGDAGTDGSGAVPLKLAMPYKNNGADRYVGSGKVVTPTYNQLCTSDRDWETFPFEDNLY